MRTLVRVVHPRVVVRGSTLGTTHGPRGIAWRFARAAWRTRGRLSVQAVAATGRFTVRAQRGGRRLDAEVALAPVVRAGRVVAVDATWADPEAAARLWG